MPKLANRPQCNDITRTGDPCPNLCAKDKAMYKGYGRMTYFRWCSVHLASHGIYVKTKAERQAVEAPVVKLRPDDLVTPEFNPFSRLSVLSYLRKLSDRELLSFGLRRVDKGFAVFRPRIMTW